MVDNHEARRAGRRRFAPLYVADIVCRLGLLAVLPVRHSGQLSRTGALTLMVVLLAGLLVCGAIVRRMPDAPASSDARAYRRLRTYVRENHPLLYGAELVPWPASSSASC